MMEGNVFCWEAGFHISFIILGTSVNNNNLPLTPKRSVYETAESNKASETRKLSFSSYSWKHSQTSFNWNVWNNLLQGRSIIPSLSLQWRFFWLPQNAWKMDCFIKTLMEPNGSCSDQIYYFGFESLKYITGKQNPTYSLGACLYCEI